MTPQQHVPGKSDNELHTFMKQRQHYYGKVTTVFVRFVSEACGSDGSGSGTVPKSGNVAAMMALSRCVEAASKLATLFNGALQYMQGCAFSRLNWLKISS